MQYSLGVAMDKDTSFIIIGGSGTFGMFQNTYYGIAFANCFHRTLDSMASGATRLH